MLKNSLRSQRKKNLHFMWFWCKQSLYRAQTNGKEETEMKIREIIFNLSRRATICLVYKYKVELLLSF